MWPETFNSPARREHLSFSVHSEIAGLGDRWTPATPRGLAMTHAFVGFAAPYDCWAVNAQGQRVSFARGCFDDGLGGPCDLVWNHQPEARVWGVAGPLASTRNGTLHLFVNAAGLFCRVWVVDEAVAELLATTDRRLSVGARSRFDWRGAGRVTVRAAVTEISVLVGLSAAHRDTWLRMAGAYAEGLVTRLDREARRRARDEVRAAC
jgi:hypothetical protein